MNTNNSITDRAKKDAYERLGNVAQKKMEKCANVVKGAMAALGIISTIWGIVQLTQAFSWGSAISVAIGVIVNISVLISLLWNRFCKDCKDNSPAAEAETETPKPL